MGPTIILDKSAFQSLSQKEIWFLFKHYYVVVTPVLLIEILADLKKPTEGESLSKDGVRTLSNKLLSVDSCINVHYYQICIASLLGAEIPMRGQALVAGGHDLQTSDGRAGTFFEEGPEREAIRNWQQGLFSRGEEVLAERWRKTTSAIDFESTKKAFQSFVKRPPSVKTLSELRSFLEKGANQPDPELQKSILDLFLTQLGAPQEIRNVVFDRWLERKMPRLRESAPYAYHCFMVNALFNVGIFLNLVSTRATNQVDLEYLYYAPFAMVFCSGDKFHRDLWPFALRNDQTFIERDELKADLRNIAAEWDSLSESERKEREYDYGPYPPPNEKSLTHRVWQKYMAPWKPAPYQRILDGKRGWPRGSPELFDGEHILSIESLVPNRIRSIQREIFTALLVPLFAWALDTDTR